MTRAAHQSPSPAAIDLVDGFSLEMTARDVPELRAAADAIPAGTKVNVTYLGNEDITARLAAARAIRELGFIPVPHISARRLASRGELEDFLERLEDIGAVESLVVVGGDPATPEGPYDSSEDVIRTGLLREHGVRSVSLAGYPEGHPDIADEVLWGALERKLSALEEQGISATIITQFAFDPDAVRGWIERVRAEGIDNAIRVGTPGPAGIKRLVGFARRFGIGANAMIVKKYGFSLTNLLGTAGPDAFVTELSENLPSTAGEVGLHIYTFGGLTAASDWARGFAAGRR